MNNIITLFLEDNIINPILIGDMNARIGEKQQQLQDLVGGGTWFEIRNSKDKIENARGRILLDFCDDFGLIVLNGRTKGDLEGNFTFISQVGESTIDYCIVNKDVLQRLILDFEVDFKSWSDHLPIKLNLGGRACKMSKCCLLPKLNWNIQKIEKYQENLNKNIGIISRVKDINIQDLQEAIEQSSIRYQRKSKRLGKNEWFNKECEEARTSSFQSLSALRESYNETNKLLYLKANKYFKEVCKRKREEWYNRLIENINNIKDSASWWKFVKKIKGEALEISSAISTHEFKIYFENLLSPTANDKKILYAHNFHTDDLLEAVFSPDEVRSVLNKVKLNKAPGIDRIPYEFLKNAPDTFITAMASAYTNLYEKCKVDEAFRTSVVFPIFKKGDPALVGNYRGISFMNCIAKVMMGIINERITSWTERNSILNEYQAGFRKNYSTVDNIFNLAAIVHLKFEEKKKVYAYFVDFKAAFDRVSRNALIYKLHHIGLATKLVKFIENIYSDTKTVVWNGSEISDTFKTNSGVKQGCLLSPILFALYINDLHESLEGGLNIEGKNIRLLMYADDIILLADHPGKLQVMINNLESYCNLWNLEVNRSKSQIMVFRKGGKLSKEEKWYYSKDEIQIVSRYTYLGVEITPQMNFKKHVENRTAAAKNGINASWTCLLKKKEISIEAKWKLFLAVCRSIQSYAAQVWGFGCFEEVDILQKYFVKRILKLPSHMPTYILFLETGMQENHLFTLELFLKYMHRILFIYSENRLPHYLSKTIIKKEVFWIRDLKNLYSRNDVIWRIDNIQSESWIEDAKLLLTNHNQARMNMYIQKALSTSRIYKELDWSKGLVYLKKYDIESSMWIMRARSDMVILNNNRFDTENKTCSMCNLGELENIAHFLARCPILREYRKVFFGKFSLNNSQLIEILNGENDHWDKLLRFIKYASRYRDYLIKEFNWF